MTIAMENRRESNQRVNRPKRYAQILDCFKNFQRTQAEIIAAKTGIPLYQVRPRLTELVQAGRLRVCGKAWSFSTGRNTSIFEVV